MSINLVRKELEITLQKAEGYFSIYAEKQDPSQLKLFADELNLARGTFKLLELGGLEALSAEMLSLIGDGTVNFTTKLEALGKALMSLSHYISLLLEHEKDRPILLIPAINLIRKAGGHKVFSESHFFNVNLRPKLPSIDKSSLDIIPHLPRIRLMYQLGLLRVLRDSDARVGMKLIQRSLTLLELGFRGGVPWPFWWSCKAAVSVIINEEYELTQARRVLLGRIDSIMRSMIKEGLIVFTAQPANELHKDLLHLVSLSVNSDGIVGDIKDSYRISQGMLEKDLKVERNLLSGPDVGAYESLSKAFNEEIAHVKEALDSAAKNNLSEEGFGALSEKLSKLADILHVIDEKSLAKRLKEQNSNVIALASLEEEERVDALAKIADDMLQVELASSHFGRSQPKTDGENVVVTGHYIEARIILFDEIESGLAMAKRAIGSFVESNDKLHLVNISASLMGVRGALIFLGEVRASAIVDATINYLNDKVLNSDDSVDEARLEILADALASVEYHAERLSHSDIVSAEILDRAVRSMSQLGYKVS
jgi:hypothetical protein